MTPFEPTGDLAAALATTMPPTTTPPEAAPRGSWRHSLYNGAAGVALQHIDNARTTGSNRALAQQWLAAICQEPIDAHPDTSGLDRGSPAVAFTLHAAGHPACHAAVASLDPSIESLTRQRLAGADQRLSRGQRPRLHEFDLIRGLTGLGVYQLHRHDGQPTPLLVEVLDYLVQLTEPVTDHDGVTMPGWWTSDAPTGEPSLEWPGGHGNLGLAHGIAGPLALLSIALRHGITVHNHHAAIERICAWLDRWRMDARSGAWWPGTISAREHDTGHLQRSGPHRPSWCYGTPGLARAQQLAGIATGDTARRCLVEDALLGCVTDHHQLDQLHDTSLCHGWTGLLHTTWRVARDAEDPTRYPLTRLTSQLITQLRRHGPPGAPGLLDGGAGIHLVSQTHATGHPPASRWDACLLLDMDSHPPPSTLSDHHHQPLPSRHGVGDIG